MNICKNCLYNIDHECMLISARPTNVEAKEAFETSITLAYTYDADSYESGLIVNDNFGCNQFKQKGE